VQPLLAKEARACRLVDYYMHGSRRVFSVDWLDAQDEGPVDVFEDDLVNKGAFANEIKKLEAWKDWLKRCHLVNGWPGVQILLWPTS
jgi:hypothetical protein